MLGKGQNQVDIYAAYQFVKYTLSFFDTTLLHDFVIETTLPNSQTKYQMFHDIFKEIKLKGFKSRFFDNRSSSLLSQLPDLYGVHCGDKERNFLTLWGQVFMKVR